MITGKLKSDIDKLWEAFWTGGITNPLTAIEQILFLMFIRLLDITETRNEKRARRTGRTFKRVYRDDQQHLRWASVKRLGGARGCRCPQNGAYRQNPLVLSEIAEQASL